MSILNEFPAFLLILVRLTSVFVVLPIFSYRTIPAAVKLGLALILSFIVATVLVHKQPIQFNELYVLLISKEVLVGLTIGFVSGLIVYAIQFAGAFIDIQIGFAIANTINPENGATSPITGQFLYTLAILFFLGINAHHMLLNGVLYSFSLVPINQLSIHLMDGTTVHFVVTVFLQMVAISFQMALPIVGSLFLVDVALGLVARTVPQINIFVVGLPLKIVVGFILLIFIFPILFIMFRSISDSMTQIMVEYMKYLGGNS